MILEYLKTGDIKAAYALLRSGAKEGVELYAKEYNNQRDLRDSQVGKRTDKSDGTRVAKIPIPFQRKIVKSAASFLFGSPVRRVSGEESDASQALTDLWRSCRMDSLLLDFCEAVKSETEAALIFYEVKKEKGVEVKARLLNHSKGKIYPSFDEYGDLIAFGWEFETKEGDKKIPNLYVFTSEQRYAFKKLSQDWELNPEQSGVNLFKKIPVVYLSQKHPEWWEVQDLIDRFEMSYSKFCDTNDYFASPMFIAEGSVEVEKSGGKGQKIINKDETGKLLTVDIVETKHGNIIKGGAKYLTWDQAPEATKLEFETTKDLIYGLSSTPNLTMEAVKGIGQIANTGMKLMFLAPILKSKWDEGSYKTAISRAINILIAGLENVMSAKGNFEELSVDIQFTSVLPENIKETIETLAEASGGQKIISQKTSVALNPMVKDPDSEIQAIKEEEASVSDLGESFK